MRLTALALIVPAATACVSTSVFAPTTDCSALVPDEWRSGVPNAAPPAQADNDLDRLKGWINFGVAQTGNLEIANGRTADAIGIVERCEERDRAAVRRSRPKFLGLF